MPERFEVRFSHASTKLLRKIPNPWRKRIIEVGIALEKDPFYGNKMYGKYLGKRKVVVWPYRILYTVDERERVVKILKIGHRSSIGYK